MHGWSGPIQNERCSLWLYLGIFLLKLSCSLPLILPLSSPSVQWGPVYNKDMSDVRWCTLYYLQRFCGKKILCRQMIPDIQVSHQLTLFTYFFYILGHPGVTHYHMFIHKNSQSNYTFRLLCPTPNNLVCFWHTCGYSLFQIYHWDL